MNQNIHTQIAALGKMTPSQLRDKYLEVFGEPTRSGIRWRGRQINWDDFQD